MSVTTSAVMLVGTAAATLIGAMFVVISLALHILLGFRQHDHTVRSDWFWYAILPPIGYLLFVAAAAAALRGAPVSAALFAAALALMLGAAIRNAWDIIVFFVTQARSE